MESPFGTVVQLIREALTERSVSAATYDAAVVLLGVPLLVDLVTLAGRMRALPHCSQSLTCS
jgi:hypothetical protein